MNRDPTYRELRGHTGPAVHEYRKHTYVVQDFIVQHGLKDLGWETWDVAPFHVLNARKGKPVPQEILHALDAAISGRESVSDKFTEANINPKVLMDASDITHRVFVEKLRTLRRVWFPNVPEDIIAAPTTRTMSSLTSRLTLVQTPTEATGPTSIGAFSALAGGLAGSDFYKVSFDTPVELTMVSGTVKRSFEIGAGHVKLKRCSPSSSTQSSAKCKVTIPSLKQTAIEVAARVTAHLRVQKRKSKDKQAGLIQQPGNIRRQIMTRSMTNRPRVRVAEPEYILISDEEDGDTGDDTVSTDKTLFP